MKRWGRTVAAGAALLAGCGKDWQVETYPATGTVTVNGVPAGGAIVQLHPTGGETDKRKSRPWGQADAGGSFTLTTYEPNDGAPAGTYAATVKWPEDASRPSFFDRLGGKFDDPETSTWRVTIGPGENVLPAIAIEGVKVTATDPAASAGRAAGAGKRNPFDVAPGRKR